MKFQTHETENHQQKSTNSMIVLDITEVKSEAVFILGIAEVDDSSILFCRAAVICYLQKVASDDFRCLKDFDFKATVLVIGGGGFQMDSGHEGM